MNEIIKKLHKENLQEFIPLIEEMANKGASKDDIIRAYQAQMKIKQGNFYADRKDTMGSILKGMSLKADSKAEVIFFKMLVDGDFGFEFQYAIGPYIADYLIDGYLVVELDGPHHNNQKKRDDRRDAYLKKHGYEVFRIPLQILMDTPRAVLEGLRECLKKTA